MTGPFLDPLAGYTPDWRQRVNSDFPDDPLAGYAPNWRARQATAAAVFGPLDTQRETTIVPPERTQDFQIWLRQNQVQDLDNPESHYDYGGAFLAGVNRGPDGHWPDTYKRHGEPTFSEESQYSRGPGDGGTWQGPNHDQFQPSADPLAGYRPDWREQPSYTAAMPEAAQKAITPGPEGEFVLGLGGGLAKGAIQFPIDVARTAVGAAFGEPTAEELANPLVRASITNRLGTMGGDQLAVDQVQPSEPLPGNLTQSQVRPDVPGPVSRVAKMGEDLALLLPRSAKELVQNPDPYAKGEAAAGVLGGLAMLHGGISKAGSFLDAYRARQAPAEIPINESAAPMPEQLAVSPETPERPVQAVVVINGQRFTGPDHMSAIVKAQEAGHDIESAPDMIDQHGLFITDRGRIVDDQEALALARAANQITPEAERNIGSGENAGREYLDSGDLRLQGSDAPERQPVIMPTPEQPGPRLQEFDQQTQESEQRMAASGTVPPEVQASLKRLDNLGFDTTVEAANAILGDPTWQTSWDLLDVPDEDMALLEHWRAQATQPQPGSVAGGMMGKTPEEMEQLLHPSNGLPEGVSAPEQRQSVENITNGQIDQAAVDELVGKQTAEPEGWRSELPPGMVHPQHRGELLSGDALRIQQLQGAIEASQFGIQANELKLKDGNRMGGRPYNAKELAQIRSELAGHKAGLEAALAEMARLTGSQPAGPIQEALQKQQAPKEPLSDAEIAWRWKNSPFGKLPDEVRTQLSMARINDPRAADYNATERWLDHMARDRGLTIDELVQEHRKSPYSNIRDESIALNKEWQAKEEAVLREHGIPLEIPKKGKKPKKGEPQPGPIAGELQKLQPKTPSSGEGYSTPADAVHEALGALQRLQVINEELRKGTNAKGRPYKDEERQHLIAARSPYQSIYGRALEALKQLDPESYQRFIQEHEPQRAKPVPPGWTPGEGKPVPGLKLNPPYDRFHELELRLGKATTWEELVQLQRDIDATRNSPGTQPIYGELSVLKGKVTRKLKKVPQPDLSIGGRAAPVPESVAKTGTEGIQGKESAGRRKPKEEQPRQFYDPEYRAARNRVHEAVRGVGEVGGEVKLDAALAAVEQKYGAEARQEMEANLTQNLGPDWRPKHHQVGAPVEGSTGHDTGVLFPDGSQLPARYRVIEARDLKSSHDPFNFQPTEGYPAGVQGRDYQRNKGAQETAQARALNLNPNLALNPSLTAAEGQPVILPDGTVLVGNERSMHPRIAAELAPEKYATYRRALADRAQEFGLDAEAIDRMERPVLVRELTGTDVVEKGPKEWAKINRLSDEVSTKRKSSVEEGAARSQALRQAHEALDHFSGTIAWNETVSEYLGRPEGRQFVKLLLDKGVISKEELGRFTSGDGQITTDGRTAIRDMLLSTAVRDPAVLIDAPPAIVGKLEHAVPAIVALRDTGWDPSPLVTRALRTLAEARAKGLALRDLRGQGDLLGAPEVPPLVSEFAAWLQQTPKSDISEAFRRYAALAGEAIKAEGSVDMFGGTGYDPAKAFREAFKLEPTFTVGMGAGKRNAPRGDEMSLFGQQDLGGLFSERGADQPGPVGSRPATEPKGAIQLALAKQGGAYRIEPTGKGSFQILDPQGKVSDYGLPEAEAKKLAAWYNRREQLIAEENAKPEPPRAPIEEKPADAFLGRGKFTPEEIAANPEAVQSDELQGIPTEHAKGQKDFFRSGMGSAKTKIKEEPGSFAKAYAERSGGTPPLPEAGGQPSGAQLPKPQALADYARAVFSPATVSDAAQAAANTVRFRNAERAHDLARAEHNLRAAGAWAQSLSKEEQFTLDDMIERGTQEQHPDPKARALASQLRELLDGEARKIQALGTGKLQQLIADYLPHIWTDPEKAREVIGQMNAKRPFRGSQHFLRQRSIATMREGLEAGLVPVTYNPVEMALLKYTEMRRYRMAAEILREEKNQGRLTFGSSLAKAPDGLVRINDPAFTKMGPPVVQIQEAFDALVREGLTKVIASLPDLTHERMPNIGGTRWGYAEGPHGKRMVTKFGGDATIIEHELGHILDFRYKLWDKLVEPPPKESHTFTKGKRAGQTVERGQKQDAATIKARKGVLEELRALADLRYEGRNPDDVTPHFKKYVRDHYEQIANAIHALIHAPEKMQRVAPTVKARLERFLKSDPKLRPILDIKPSLRLGSGAAEKGLPGFTLLGHYYADPAVARILNNFLSPGLRGHAPFDLWMGAGNLLNQAQLGLSAFHLGFTSFDAATSKLALALEQADRGQLGQAIKSAAGVPLAPITNLLQGRKVRAEYLKPGSHPALAKIVEALDIGGGRVNMDIRYSNNSLAAFLGALRARSYGKAGAYAIPALIEAAAKPIMEVIVPAQKLGVFADLAKFELGKLPRGGKAELNPAQMALGMKAEQAPYSAAARQAMGKAWDSVENRLGQMTYDNLFWNKTFKDLLHATVRAVGWDVGTVRELGGGIRDVAKGPALTHRSAYVVALPMLVGMTGAVINYLYTGQGPQSLKDYFYPRTGQRNEDGNEERIQLPSYMKDIVGFARHPVNTVTHKLHPLISLVGEMLTNQDFYGTEIRNPDDPLVKQVAQEVAHIIKGFEPLGSRNARQPGQSRTTKALNFIGVTPAPREMVRSPAQNAIADALARRGHGVRSPEEAEATQRRRSIQDAYKAGQVTPSQLADSMRAGALTPMQRKNILRHSDVSPMASRFKQLSWEEAEQAYEKANPTERADLWPVLKKKRVLAYRMLVQGGIKDERTEALLRAIRGEGHSTQPGESLLGVAR